MALATATLVFEVQTGGSDNNGGGFDSGVTSPGTDYSQQASAQVAFTDLVIGGAGNTDKLTSAAHPFGATSPGNVINITGGTGFTTGLYRILSVSGTTATMDRSVGTAGSTGGTGNLGGAFATINKATSNMGLGGQVAYVKAGTYSISAGITSPVLNTAANYSVTRIIGYSSTRGDNGQATIQASVGVTMFSADGTTWTSSLSWENITFDGNSKSAVAFQLDTPSQVRLEFLNCIFKNFHSIYVISGNQIHGGINIQGCEFSNNALTGGTGAVIYFTTSATYGTAALNVIDSVFTGNTITSTTVSAAIFAEGCGVNVSRCIVYNNTGTNMSGITLKDPLFANIQNNDISSNTKTGILLDSSDQTSPTVSIVNNIISGSTTGIKGTFANTPGIPYINHNAYWNNTTDKSGFTAGDGEVSLTASPYANIGSNFALNSTANAGLACRGKGTPGSLGVSSVLGTGALDIGAIQHGTASGAFTFVS
jgi:hypothetical protein